jgi:hypothetical protein
MRTLASRLAFASEKRTETMFPPDAPFFPTPLPPHGPKVGP